SSFFRQPRPVFNRTSIRWKVREETVSGSGQVLWSSVARGVRFVSWTEVFGDVVRIGAAVRVAAGNNIGVVALFLSKFVMEQRLEVGTARRPFPPLVPFGIRADE